MKRIIIIGGGITGLSIAYYLEKHSLKKNIPCEILLLEASGRLGGALQTESCDGYLLELGAESFLSEKPWGLQLCRELGLEKELINTRPENRRSFVVHNRRLVPVPDGFYLTAPANLLSFFASPLFSLPGKLRAAAEQFLPPNYTTRDESIANFIRRRFGPEIYERVGQAMIGGVYSGNPEKLSILATFPKFREFEGKYHSVIRGLNEKKDEESHEEASGPRYSLFLSLQNGMETLIHALQSRLQKTQIRLNASVKKMEFGKSWGAVLPGDEILKADAICLAIPAQQTAQLLKEVNTDFSAGLSRLSAESSVTINLAFSKKEIPELPRGFGFVVPAIEKMKTVGCTFSSQKYSGRAPEDGVLLRVFAGGWQDPGAVDKSDAFLIETALAELKQLLNITAKPKLAVVKRYVKAMPQYEVGHFSHVEILEKQARASVGLHLAGNSYRGIGIPDCIRESEKTALALLA